MRNLHPYLVWLLVAFVFIAALAASGFYLWGVIMGMHCPDFTSQDAAQEAFNWGNKNLDGDGDSFACETLK